MNEEIEKRVLHEANMIINTKETLRQLARELTVSKSTIHKDMKERLSKIDYDKYLIVKSIFQEHIEQRHINGGISTKQKYKLKQKQRR